jgi:hypothetical protein
MKMYDEYGPYKISTVQIPGEQAWETLVFRNDEALDIDGAKYDTAAKAYTGHRRFLNKYALLYDYTEGE